MGYVVTFSSHVAAVHARQSLRERGFDVSSMHIVRRRTEDLSHGIILGSGIGGLALLAGSSPYAGTLHIPWLPAVGPFMSLLFGIVLGGAIGAYFDGHAGRRTDGHLFAGAPGRAAIVGSEADEKLLKALREKGALAILPSERR